MADEAAAPHGRDITNPASLEENWANMLDALTDQIRARNQPKNEKGQVNRYFSRERAIAITHLEEAQNWLHRLILMDRAEPITPRPDITLARVIPDQVH